MVTSFGRGCDLAELGPLRRMLFLAGLELCSAKLYDPEIVPLSPKENPTNEEAAGSGDPRAHAERRMGLLATRKALPN